MAGLYFFLGLLSLICTACALVQARRIGWAVMPYFMLAWLAAFIPGNVMKNTSNKDKANSQISTTMARTNRQSWNWNPQPTCRSKNSFNPTTINANRKKQAMTPAA